MRQIQAKSIHFQARKYVEKYPSTSLRKVYQGMKKIFKATPSKLRHELFK